MVSLQAAVSGLKASQTRVDVAAHDVANINTDGFRDYQPVQTETYPSGTEISALTRGPTPPPDRSGTDFAVEAKEIMISVGSYKADARVFRVQNDMLGELLDMKA
jgi:flagellar hook protein FlgE